MQVLEQMLKKYKIDSVEDKKHTINEIIQEIVPCGLSWSKFFKDSMKLICGVENSLKEITKHILIK